MKKPSELRVTVPPNAATTAVFYPGADPSLSARGGPRPFAEPRALGPPISTDDTEKPVRARAALILAHGAGADQRSPFMAGFAHAIAALGVDVVTFNFLYTEQRRRSPDQAPVLETCYRAVIDAVRDRGQIEPAGSVLFIGGKSLGGRIATQVAAADRELPVAGLVLLGYPLHPPGRPERRRDAHLAAVKRPMLFVQGERDTFGTPAELSPLVATLNPQSALHVVAGGDHSLKVSRRDSVAQAAIDDDVQRTIVQWIARVNKV